MGADELELLLRVIPLAIGAAFTPSLFGLQLVAAASPNWIRRTVGTAVGSGLAFAIALVVLYLGFASLPLHSDQKSAFDGVIWLLVGIALGATAMWMFLPHPELAAKMEKRLTSGLDKANTWTFFGVAFALSIKDVTSFALLLPAMHDIAAADVGWWFKLPTAGIVYAIAMCGVLIPPLWRLIRGAHAEKTLNRMFHYTMAHQFTILGVVAVFFALYCVFVAAGADKLGWTSW